VDDQTPEATAEADADLVLRTRSGDADAFGELWRRHYRSGMTVARSVTSSIDPDDLVQESYARIYQAILKGGGPNGSFRAYLFTSIRNTAAAWGRARRETAIDELETVADPSSTESAVDEELDRGLTARAFRSLPSRWQEVLWYSEIEQMKPAAIGGLLGMSAGAVSQLTFRAREGLREAWIQAHLRSVGEGSECQWTIEHLGAYSRGNLAARAQQRADRHLGECARCLIVAGEAKDVSSRLALVLLPLVLGVSGASAYLATLQGGGAPIVALAAMPSSVIEGAVVVTSGSGAVAGSSASGATSGSGTAGGSGAAGGTAGGSGAMSGLGALVGAGSAALVVAGVVAAAAVVPGMLNGAPATSQPSASESEASAITSEVVPDSAMSADQPMVIEIDDEQQPPPPQADAPEPTPPQGADAVAPPAAPEIEPAPEPEPAPDPGIDEPGTENPGTEDPGTAPEEPGTEEPGTGNPDPGTGEPDPGTEEPGTEEPGTEEPGTENPDPGTEEPGTEDPDPGAEEPGTGVTPVELTWGDADVSVDSGFVTHYRVPVIGTPGATVQVWIDRVAGGGDEIVLGEDGTGTADLRPSFAQLFLSNPEVGFRYVIDGVPGEWSTTRLKSLGSLFSGVAATDSDTRARATAAPDAPAPPQTSPAPPEATTSESEPAAPETTASVPAAPAAEPTAAQTTAPEQTAPADESPAE